MRGAILEHKAPTTQHPPTLMSAEVKKGAPLEAERGENDDNIHSMYSVPTLSSD